MIEPPCVEVSISPANRLIIGGPLPERTQQVVEVLTGADTPNVRKWQHQNLSTYGIGQDHTEPQWKVIGRELIRLGLLSQVAEKFQVVNMIEHAERVLADSNAVPGAGRRKHLNDSSL